MDQSLQLSPRQLHLVLASHHAQRQMMTLLTARLALTGRVRLVDAGNCFDGYGLARQLRQDTSFWQKALERVSVARAFTCYQVETLLTESVSDFSPVLVLNLLDTFYDENVNLQERLRLLKVSLGELRRLHRTASVAVSTCIPTPDQPLELLEMLSRAAGAAMPRSTSSCVKPIRFHISRAASPVTCASSPRTWSRAGWRCTWRCPMAGPRLELSTIITSSHQV